MLWWRWRKEKSFARNGGEGLGWDGIYRTYGTHWDQYDPRVQDDDIARLRNGLSDDEIVAHLLLKYRKCCVLCVKHFLCAFARRSSTGAQIQGEREVIVPIVDLGEIDGTTARIECRSAP
jgi:hypothetical protein